MSFFFALHSKKLKKIGRSKSKNVSLQLRKSATSINYASVAKNSVLVPPIIHNNFVTQSGKAKRTFLSTTLKGSITIEASIVLPVFIFALLSVLYFFNIIYIQITMQIHLENAARKISSYTCITSAADVNLNDDENSLLEKVIIDSAGTVAITGLFITNEMKDFADNSLIVNGHEGLSFWGSDVTNTNFPMNLVLSYDVKMPFISEDVFTFHIEQNCYFKPFNGKKLIDDTPLDERYVYVTKTGDTFHSDKYCSHLERFTFVHNMKFLLEDYPSIVPCAICSKDNPLFADKYISSPIATFVYVTKTYDVYHYLEACPSIERNLILKTYDEAKENYSPCSSCVVYTY